MTEAVPHRLPNTDATTVYLHSDGYKATVALRSHIPSDIILLFTRRRRTNNVDEIATSGRYIRTRKIQKNWLPALLLFRCPCPVKRTPPTSRRSFSFVFSTKPPQKIFPHRVSPSVFRPAVYRTAQPGRDCRNCNCSSQAVHHGRLYRGKSLRSVMSNYDDYYTTADRHTTKSLLWAPCEGFRKHRTVAYGVHHQ